MGYEINAIVPCVLLSILYVPSLSLFYPVLNLSCVLIASSLSIIQARLSSALLQGAPGEDEALERARGPLE
ncbi:MAG TPA: hypothetical protein VFQ92_19465, partial [Blastocatellia bacterium]|nr:hypothetical protein [Blastocatellia bacterium]